MRLSKYDLYFIIILALSVGVDVFISGRVSISYNEALMYFNNNNLISKLANLSTSYFGRNDYALRIGNMVFNAINLILIYLISRKILKRPIDSVICAILYALIPGVIMQGVILNQSSIMLCLILLICYSELNGHKILYPLFVITIFIDNSAFILFIALIIYGIYYKKYKIIIFGILCLMLNLYIYGIDISGRPSGKFLDVFRDLSLLYSPPLFIYYIYTLYRNMSKERKSLLLIISVTSLLVSVILSIRQTVDKEVFLYMSLCGIPLMIKQFFTDIRVRLPQFQKNYRQRFIIIYIFLFIESSLLIFSKELYIFINKPSGVFLDSFYIAKELSEELKARNIQRVHTQSKSLQTRLAFYGINDGGVSLKRVQRKGNIQIKYHNTIIAQFNI